MITVLSGGTGTPKLLQGFMKVIDPGELFVIVNTSEDHWLSHGFISPDVDTVVYTLAGLVDEDSWHGILDDTFETHRILRELAASEYLRIGDRDRALHIWRGERLRSGSSLSEVTCQHCYHLGIKSTVFPMTDDTVETRILSDGAEMDLHQFWVQKKGKPKVDSLMFRGLPKAKAIPEAVTAINKSDKVIIGPSNPVTSITPILGVEQLGEALVENQKKVIAISPLLDGKAFSGPAENLMKAIEIDVSNIGLAEYYKDYISALVVDPKEMNSDHGKVEFLKRNILLDTIEKKVDLSEFLLTM